jgi:hypothetical protein
MLKVVWEYKYATCDAIGSVLAVPNLMKLPETALAKRLKRLASLLTTSLYGELGGNSREAHVVDQVDADLKD